ncbi:MAG: DMT family transporter [Cyanobacteria bacterium P01_H01_bin.130]
MSSIQKVNLKPVLILGIGVLAISTGAIFSRWAIVSNQAAEQLAQQSPNPVGFGLFLAAGRVAIATLSLLPIWLWSRRRPPIPTLTAPADSTSPLWGSGIPWAIIAGLCLAIHFTCWITSLTYTSIAASTVLVTTNPIWIALATWILFGDRPRRSMVLGIAIALGGSIIIGSASDGSTGSQPWLGNLLALDGAWSFSTYFLLGRTAQRRGLSPSTYGILTSATAAIALLPFPLLAGETYHAHAPWIYGCVLLSALIPQLIGHSSINWAMTQLHPTHASLALLFEPIGASLLGYWVFGEQPGWTVVLGAIAVLGGLLITLEAPSRRLP